MKLFLLALLFFVSSAYALDRVQILIPEPINNQMCYFLKVMQDHQQLFQRLQKSSCKQLDHLDLQFFKSAASDCDLNKVYYADCKGRRRFVSVLHVAMKHALSLKKPEILQKILAIPGVKLSEYTIVTRSKADNQPLFLTPYEFVNTELEKSPDDQTLVAIKALIKDAIIG